METINIFETKERNTKKGIKDDRDYSLNFMKVIFSNWSREIDKKEGNKRYSKLPKPEGDKDRTADISKALELLGWFPKISIDEGLMHTFRWAREYLETTV